MVVKLLLKILERYSLCEKGVKIQFVTHKKGSVWNDEIYEDSICVTPYDYNGNLNHYSSRYFHDVKFSDWEKRSAFHDLIDRYNAKNKDKSDFVPLYSGSNYCRII